MIEGLKREFNSANLPQWSCHQKSMFAPKRVSHLKNRSLGLSVIRAHWLAMLAQEAFLHATRTSLRSFQVTFSKSFMAQQLLYSLSMIRKLKTGNYRLYSRKADPKTGKRRNLGTFGTRQAAEKHERAVQFFKRAH
ncbi:MAG TPA: hypothetical protein VFO27_12760 [Bryobacteraceae bacterium]|nr:hypothetical protein [Bryobacteraceae bacterium]